MHIYTAFMKGRCYVTAV